MGSAPKWRFVDRSGSPFSLRYHQAMDSLSRTLWRSYSYVRDEADRDNAMQETLCRAAIYEQKYGEVGNLSSLIRWIFPQVVSSMFVRKPYYARREESRDVGELETLRSTLWESSSLENRVYAQELLCSLGQRERHIVSLLVLGHKPDEIAAALDVSAENVYQILHRARKYLKQTR
jgi:RNA polymerase sigma factor (sigma-70 family)